MEELRHKKLEKHQKYLQLIEEIGRWNEKVMDLRLGKKVNKGNMVVENYLYSSLKNNLQELG